MNRYIALAKIVELGSFTKAANILGYTQPAISQMVVSLEKELSLKLLYRSRYGIRLTPEGERLFPSIQQTVAQYESMQEIAKELRGLESGIIRIGTFSSISANLLPRLIKGFQSSYPGVQFVLHQGDYSSIPEWVRTGQVDFGFVNPDAVRGMETKVILEDALMAVVPSGHALSGKGSVTLKELAGEPFLLLEEGAYSETLEAFSQEKLEPNVILRAHDDYSILSMIEEGIGVSIIPAVNLRKVSYDVSILPLQPAINRRLGLVMKDKNILPLASKRFIRFLLDNVSIL